MPITTVTAVAITKLDDWVRIYLVDFGDSFVEFSAPTPPTFSGPPTITADSGITVTYAGTNVDPVGINILISGGVAGNSYNVTVSVALSTADVLSVPIVVNVVAPGRDGLPQQTLAKLPSWERHYLFPFGKIFPELATPGATFTEAVFNCEPAEDGSVLSGSPIISGSSVIVFVSGGNPGQTYQVRCTATMASGIVLSIPGVIAD